MTRRLLTGLAALMLITSVAVAQSRPGKGPFRGGELPRGVRVLEEGGGGPGHGPQARSQARSQARPQAEAIGRVIRQLAQRLDRLEKQVRAIVAHARTGAGAQARRPDARRGMQGRRGMATHHGAPTDRGARLRRLLQARPELRQRLAQSPELRQRLAQRFQGQGQRQGQGQHQGQGRFQGRRMGADGPRQMRGGRGMGAMRPGAMRERGPKPGGEHACPHCGKGAAPTKADPRRRAIKAKAMQRAAHRPEGRGPAAERPGRGAPMAGQRMAAENARLKAEIQKLQAQMARLTAAVKKLHGAK